MGYNNHLMFSYDNRPLSLENKDSFQFSSHSKKTIDTICQIIDNEYGVYLIGGNKGCGKTSIFEQAKLKHETKNIKSSACYIKMQLCSYTDFCLNMLFEVEKLGIIRTKAEQEELSRLIMRFGGIITSKSTIKFLESASVSNSANDVNISEKSASVAIQTPTNPVLQFMFANNLSNKRSQESSKNNEFGVDKEIIHQYEKIYSENEAKREFVCFIRQISRDYKLVIILDELDKVPKEKIVDFIHENKIVLLESDILLFLICGLYQAIYLEDVYPDYFSKIMYVTDLSLQDFLEVTKSLEFCDTIKSSVLLYTKTKGNFRKLIQAQKDCEGINYCDLEPSALLIASFVYSDFLKDMSPHYINIIMDFVFYFINTLKIVGEITVSDSYTLKKEYCLYRNIESFKVQSLLDKALDTIKEPILAPILQDIFNYRVETESLESLLDEILLKMLSPSIKVFDKHNKRFNYEAISAFNYDFKSNIRNLQIEYHEKIKAIQKENVYLDTLIESHIRYRLGANRTNKATALSEKAVTLVDHPTSVRDYTEDAIEKIKCHLQEVIGVIIFHPKHYLNSIDTHPIVLNNCLVVLDNGVRSIAITYDGYPGLMSHKPDSFIEFVKFLNQYGIFYRTLGDKDFAPDVFRNSILTDLEIRDIVTENKDFWIKEFLREKYEGD